LFYYTRFFQESSLENALKYFKPDVVIIDQDLSIHLIDEEIHGYPRLMIQDGRQKLFVILSKYSSGKEILRPPYFGPIYVFHFDWSSTIDKNK
jgi:hypothetical protein